MPCSYGAGVVLLKDVRLVMLTEVDLVQPPFISKVIGRPVPINEKAYVVSQQGVELLIYRQYHRLKNTRNWVDRREIKQVIKKLKAIEKDLQKALELG